MSGEIVRKPHHSSTSRLRYSFGSGYWLSPNNFVFRVSPTHIAAICDFPDRFGLDEAQLRKIFLDTGEPWRSEGKARREIIIRLVQDGRWIRVREYRRNWTVNVGDLSAPSIARIRGFFRAFGRSTVPNNSVVLDLPESQITSLVNDLIEGCSSSIERSRFLHEPIMPSVIAGPAELPAEGIPRLQSLTLDPR